MGSRKTYTFDIRVRNKAANYPINSIHYSPLRQLRTHKNSFSTFVNPQPTGDILDKAGEVLRVMGFQQGVIPFKSVLKKDFKESFHLLAPMILNKEEKEAALDQQASSYAARKGRKGMPSDFQSPRFKMLQPDRRNTQSEDPKRQSQQSFRVSQQRFGSSGSSRKKIVIADILTADESAYLARAVKDKYAEIKEKYRSQRACKRLSWDQSQMFPNAINAERANRFYKSAMLKWKREHMPVYSQKLKESIIRNRNKSPDDFCLYEDVLPEPTRVKGYVAGAIVNSKQVAKKARPIKESNVHDFAAAFSKEMMDAMGHRIPDKKITDFPVLKHSI